MHYTIFDTPVIRTLFAWISIVMLRLTGWKLEGKFPELPKYVMIAAPHTSNWDFPVTLGICFAARAKIYWMGKSSLFVGPMGPIMRWLGGIAVDRSKSNNLVQQIVDVYNRSERLVITIPPEGTRSKVREWKTGFYHIAVGAKVPIALAFLDFKRKVGGFGPMFYPTGNLEQDMLNIQAFYKDITGKNPAAFN
ncbi:lysophospholipid acyltransferase family protein [Parachitinimonas caeni]|uniref:Lysophospholipid acyltransferase family protein n=1 Tax=Parachitinimonas caeni TaxID=3031301 RepID=A0ABT7E478_9NEIS|nr:lysophospholipid acyltransferase family protein [Parachitinimonas caeni]MDK2125697.1 lysophospholipid acyltransferase family protein [Parachitinimonas caeni]